MTGTTSGSNTGETIYGTAGADKLKGLGGDDTFYVYTGNDTVDGGAGNDTVVFSGTRSQYVITPKDTGNQKVTVQGLGSNAELKKVETLKFSDGSYDIASGVFTPDVAPLPVVSLTPALVETTEGGALTFTFTRSGGNLAAPLTVNYIVNDGPPLGGATRADGDFSYPTGIQQVTFLAGQTTVTITVQTINDTAVEGDESFPVLLSGGVDYVVDSVNNGSTAVIHDNDVAPPQPVISVVATDGIGTETVDGTDFTFTFSRTGDTTAALTVNYSISPALIDGATPGTDFPAQSGTITFAAGDSTAVLQFSATHDAVVENTEFFSVLVSPGAGYQLDLPNATANGSIADGTIYGTESADNLIGTNDPDAIVALGGDDGLTGGLGADFLDGGLGSDRAIYTNAGAAVDIQLAAGTATIGATVDTLRSIEFARGTAFDDTFNAGGFGTGSTNASSQGNNFNGFEGLAGDDHIFGNGNTRIEYTTSSSAVTVTFTTGSSGTASGSGSGNDDFTGVSAVRGSQHNDLIINAGTTNNTFDGQGGFDTVSYASALAAINVNLQATAGANVTGGGGNDVLRDNLNTVTIEGIIGTNFNDTFTGNGVSNNFDGGGGVDIAVFGNTRLSSTIIDNVMGSVTVIGSGGTDTHSNVELLQFTDAYQLTSAAVNANLTGITFNANPIFGTEFNETITVGPNVNGRTIDLLGGIDTIHLGLFGAQNYNLMLAGVEFLTGRDDANENVFLGLAATGLTVDLAVGIDQLTLGSGNNVVTAISVETIQGSSGDDTVTFVLNDGTAGQQISLGGGTNVLNLEGTGTVYNLTLNNIAQVNGHAGFVHDILTVQNLQLGTTFDLGDGISDELHLNTAPVFPGGPNGVNVVTVYNTENVFGALADGDQIHIGGNSGGNVTTVTAGLGPDQIWASADSDHFRFISTGDSAFDFPVAGQRDVIHDFDASEDAFVFDFAGAENGTWERVSDFGDIVLIDFNGDATSDANNDSIHGDYAGYEMAIQLQNAVGTLTDANFMFG